MTPEFSAAVDPIFLHVLGLLERIGRNQVLPYDQERQAICHCFVRADGLLGSRPDWELAKYALVCWVDEVLGAAAWEHRKVWQNQALEFDLFETRDKDSKFYAAAQQAGPHCDALEVFYICTALGFHGLYRPPQTPDEETLRNYYLGDLHLPADREAWASLRVGAIQWGKDLPAIPENAQPIRGAPPLSGPATVVWPALVGLMLLMVGIIVGYLFFPLVRR